VALLVEGQVGMRSQVARCSYVDGSSDRQRPEGNNNDPMSLK